MEYTTSGIPKDASQAKKSLAALVLTPETMTGSGLYIWDKYENGVLTLRRSEDYWNGTARAEIVELHFGCDDLAAALENNAIDAAWNLSRAAAEELGRGAQHGVRRVRRAAARGVQPAHGRYFRGKRPASR